MIKRTFSITAMAIACLVVTFSQAGAGQIMAKDAWARATPPNATNGAAYLTLHNSTTSDIKLIGVESDVAKKTEIHIVEIKDGMMEMHKVDFVIIPANDMAELKPGGLHVMMKGLKRQLKEGEKIHLILKFDNEGDMPLTAPVTKSKDMAMKHGGMKGMQ